MFIQQREGEWSGMLDARRIGAYVSKLRKVRDLTQAELAEQLNVSHQAVSKWERGESLPDIGTIPQLAALFSLTVDELLRAGEGVAGSPSTMRQGTPRGGGAIVERLAAGEHEQAAALVNDGEVQAEELLEVAPIVKASTLGRVAAHLDRSRVNWPLIGRLAPFLPEEPLEDLVRHAAEDGADWAHVVQLAPFLSRSMLGELVERTIEGTLDFERLASLAPFLDREQLDRLVQRAEEGGLGWDAVVSLAPFLSRETLNRLVQRVEDGELEPSRLVGLAPFLGSDAIARLLERIDLGQADPELAASLAPFLDRATLTALVRSMLGGAQQA